MEIWKTNLDDDDPTSMAKVGYIDPVDLGFDRHHLPHDPWVVGNRLYVSWYKAGLHVFDISNPEKPVLISLSHERKLVEWLVPHRQLGRVSDARQEQDPG